MTEVKKKNIRKEMSEKPKKMKEKTILQRGHHTSSHTKIIKMNDD
jgi:hypothetical protein